MECFETYQFKTIRGRCAEKGATWEALNRAGLGGRFGVEFTSLGLRLRRNLLAGVVVLALVPRRPLRGSMGCVRAAKAGLEGEVSPAGA